MSRHPAGARRIAGPAAAGEGVKRILFVDDEPALLEGLRNLLRKERKQWEMVFKASGAEALEAMAERPFDVIVSDMRMPTMDGATLLAQVKERYPGTARIVLSGHAEREAVMRALPVTHQFLSKPCDAAVLRATIARACDLQRVVPNEQIKKLVGRLDRLPSIPRAYFELVEAASNPKTGLGELAAIIERDPATSTKALQVVNSGYFGLSRKVTAIGQAITYLGVELVKGLALTAHVLDDAKFPRIEGFSQDRIRQDSLRGANLARRLLVPAKGADDAFAAALVRDAGQVVLASNMPNEFRAAMTQALEQQRPMHEVERERFAVTHAELGGYLLGVWGLPLPLVQSVTYHHAPSDARDAAPEVLAAVHVASALVDDEPLTALIGAPEARIDRAFLERAGLLTELPRWLALAAEESRQGVRQLR